jgi:hypothetical protein
MGTSHITKVMVTRDMAIKGTTKGTGINKQDISKAPNSIRGPRRLF